LRSFAQTTAPYAGAAKGGPGGHFPLVFHNLRLAGRIPKMEHLPHILLPRREAGSMLDFVPA